jgi:hypothetical protein
MNALCFGQNRVTPYRRPRLLHHSTAAREQSKAVGDVTWATAARRRLSRIGARISYLRFIAWAGMPALHCREWCWLFGKRCHVLKARARDIAW